MDAKKLQTLRMIEGGKFNVNIRRIRNAETADVDVNLPPNHAKGLELLGVHVLCSAIFSFESKSRDRAGLATCVAVAL